MIVYLDTSATAKILIREAESETLRVYLDDIASRASSLIVSAARLETELRLMATRSGVALLSDTDALARIALIDMASGILREAGLRLGEPAQPRRTAHCSCATSSGG